MHVLAGLVAAFATAVLYASAVALQALEARKVPREHSLRPSLLTRLLRRPLWLLGTALAALGWAAQVGALLLIPLTLVEPTLAVSLVVLLGFGAGVAYAVDGLATKFFSDDFSGRAWLGLILWFAAMLGAAAVGTLSEMSALQIRPATKVAPIVLALTTLIPVALAPALAGETWSSSAWAQAGLVAAIVLIVGGATSLARSTAVGSVLEAEARKSRSETPRSESAESSRDTRVSVDSAEGTDESRVTTTTSPA